MFKCDSTYATQTVQNKLKLLEKLRQEEAVLLKVQEESRSENNVMALKEQLTEELEFYRKELKEKQSFVKKKERFMKEQRENFMKLTEQCRKLKELITQYKKNEYKFDYCVEEGTEKYKVELQAAELDYEEQRNNYQQLIANQKPLINELNFELERLMLILKQKIQESRINKLKINELKRRLRTTIGSQLKSIKINKEFAIDPKIIAINVQQLKKDMKAEKSINNSHQLRIKKNKNKNYTLLDK